jgi:hyperosmotically inducible periplasmic protein
MKTSVLKIAVVAIVLFGAGTALADDQDSDRAHPKTFVKDSAITAKIKTKLATEHFSSLVKIHVDTDAGGVVYLSGSAKTQEAADEAVAMARATEHVTAVHNDIRIKAKLDE